MAKQWGHYRWLDYRHLLESHLRADEELSIAKYFTSLATHHPDALPRQQKYLEALDRRGGLEVITGRYEQRKVKCRVCGQWYKRPQEKETDVSLAVNIVADAFDDNFDTLWIVCADSDLAPAVRMVKERFGKSIVVWDPPRRHSDDLADIADFHLHFARHRVRQAQLPNPVEYLTSADHRRRLFAPIDWTPPGEDA